MQDRLHETPTRLEPPRIEDRAAFSIAGLSERYHNRDVQGIPAQWQRFTPYIGRIPGQVGTNAYGVCCNFDGEGNMDYVCGVEISGGSAVPDPLCHLELAAQRYAVFIHRDHISTIRKTWRAIFNQWIPASGYKPARGPQIEAYGRNFNAVTGQGGVEIWVPIER
jgi:AraC family transcriptional regulator